jgi:uncharacterized membrane protein YheB (UPF0754 family)
MDKYECKYCNKSYKQKFNYDQHLAICEFFFKSKKEKDYEFDIMDEKIPTSREMYALIKHMMLKIDKLEKEVAKSKKIEKTTTTINVLEWLKKSPQPRDTFSMWLKKKLLPNVHHYLKVVFSDNLTSGMIQVFEDTFSASAFDDIPLRVFENKDNSYYILKKNDATSTTNEANIWVEISNKGLDRYITAVADQFSADFEKYWYNENKEKIDKEEIYKDIYSNYNKKILGGDSDTMNKNVREHIQKKLRRNIKAVREYEVL